MSDKAFMDVVEKIVTRRPKSFWESDGVVHLVGRTPDGKTECGLQAKFAEVYEMRPGHRQSVTCLSCDYVAPPPHDHCSCRGVVHTCVQA